VISAAALIVWMTGGAAIAMAMPGPDQPRCVWVPWAMLLGPMWAIIASERAHTPVFVAPSQSACFRGAPRS